MEPFGEHSVSKPYESSRNGTNKYICTLTFEDGKRRNMTYLRYCASIQQKRKLLRTEHVLPINGDFTDGREDNLRILPWKEYIRELEQFYIYGIKAGPKNPRLPSTVMNCGYDGKPFQMSSKQRHARESKLKTNPNMPGPFCCVSHALAFRYHGRKVAE